MSSIFSLGESLQNKVFFKIRRRVIWVPGIYIFFQETYKYLISNISIYLFIYLWTKGGYSMFLYVFIRRSLH